jgi:hypothetical protein
VVFHLLVPDLGCHSTASSLSSSSSPEPQPTVFPPTSPTPVVLGLLQQAFFCLR